MGRTSAETLHQAHGAGAEVPVFVDRFGFAHTLTPGYRSKIKPGWETMLSDQPVCPSEGDIRLQLKELRARIRLSVRMLEIMGCSPMGKDILVVGCDQGAEVAYLAATGAAAVTGSNYDGSVNAHSSRVDSRPTILDTACPMRSALIASIRELGGLRSFEEARVSIIDDDIAASAFEDESFDILCSWRTLEHLTNPSAVFAQMYRIVRPGGLVFHEYNPFFGIDGGHSLVTLDFPWGHARLDASDLERYLDTFRPNEKTLAMEFYQSALNRMSIAHMESFARAAGFEVEALVPRARTEDLMEVTQAVLSSVRKVYPFVTLNDLVCRVVRVVLRRP